MKLQPVTIYRIYVTVNDTCIDDIIFQLKKKYNISRISTKRSENVRNFMYIEIEGIKKDLKEEIEKIFEEKNINHIKIDIIELKKPLPL